MIYPALTITVAIVTRNRAALLAETLESLCALERRPNEVLIINNASSDRTQEIAEAFKTRLPVRVEKHDKIGVNCGRNAALCLCRTDALVFTDDDAIPHGDWISKLDASLARMPDAAAFQGVKDNYYPGDLFAALFQFCSRDIAHLRSHRNGFVTSSALVDTCNLAVRMDKIRTLGIHFDESFLKGGDRFFGQTLLERGEKIAFVANSIVDHKWPRTLFAFLRARWRSGAARAQISRKSNPAFNPAASRKISGKEYIAAMHNRMRALDFPDRMLFFPLVVLGICLNKLGALQFRIFAASRE